MAKPASVLREIRTQLGLSQAECATALGVALETFRTWDAGRRPAPEVIVREARTLKAKRPLHDRVPLQVLADELHVHVRTLRAAAHDGRLAATFGPRPYFGKLTATATREAAARFMATWYRRTYGRGQRRPVSVCRVTVPANYAPTLVGLRHRLGLSQQRLAAKIGAASAVIAKLLVRRRTVWYLAAHESSCRIAADRRAACHIGALGARRHHTAAVGLSQSHRLVGRAWDAK